MTTATMTVYEMVERLRGMADNIAKAQRLIDTLSGTTARAEKSAADGTTKRRVTARGETLMVLLLYVSKSGPQTAAQISAGSKLTMNAVNHVLYTKANAGYFKRSTSVRPVLWSLSAAGKKKAKELAGGAS